MEALNIRKKQKQVAQKVSRLATILATCGIDLLDEALASVLPLFGEDELTIFDRRRGETLSCSSLNEDVLNFITALLKKGSKVSEISVFSREDGHFLRQGVQAMKIVPVLSDGKEDVILSIENYENSFFPDDSLLQDVYMLLGAAVKQYLLIDKTNMAIKLDSATKLPTRDALIERLKCIINDGKENICLGILSISNVDKLNRTDGLESVDVLLKRVALTLDRLLPRNVYRLGGTKFAVVFPYDIHGSSACLESMVDSVLKLDKRFVTSNVVTPVRDDAYGTIFVCESHLKLCEEDIVTIVRDAADTEYAKEFQQVSETYFVKDAVAVEEPEGREDFYNTGNMVSRTASELQNDEPDPIQGTPAPDEETPPAQDIPADDGGIFIMPDDIPESAYETDDEPDEASEQNDSSESDSSSYTEHPEEEPPSNKAPADSPTEPDVFSLFNDLFSSGLS